MEFYRNQKPISVIVPQDPMANLEAHFPRERPTFRSEVLIVAPLGISRPYRMHAEQHTPLACSKGENTCSPLAMPCYRGTVIFSTKPSRDTE